MDPGFSYIIHWQAILEVKQYVEKHSLCRWLGNLKSEDGKRAKARRYRDGAVKIMDLLRPQLTPHDIMHYERLYERLQELPEYWSSERIVAAKKLWNYVLSVDEQLSHGGLRGYCLSLMRSKLAAGRMLMTTSDIEPMNTHTMYNGTYTLHAVTLSGTGVKCASMMMDCHPLHQQKRELDVWRCMVPRGLQTPVGAPTY